MAKKKNSRVKGSSYELKTAKRLTEWWGEEFHRTPGSGAWSSTHGSDHQAGDIVSPIHSKFPFVVECKNQELWSGDDIIFSTGKYPKFWEQVVGDATRVKKVPMLIAHRNYSRDYVTIPYNYLVEAALSQHKVPHATTLIKYHVEMLEEDKLFKVTTLELQEFMRIFTKETVLANVHTWYAEWLATEGE